MIKEAASKIKSIKKPTYNDSNVQVEDRQENVQCIFWPYEQMYLYKTKAKVIYQNAKNSDRKASPSRDLKHYLGKQSPRGRKNTSPLRERYQAKKAAEERRYQAYSTQDDDIYDEPEDCYMPQPKAKAIDLQQISEEETSQVSDSIPVKAIRLDRSFESSVSRQYMENIQ